MNIKRIKSFLIKLILGKDRIAAFYNIHSEDPTKEIKTTINAVVRFRKNEISVI